MIKIRLPKEERRNQLLEVAANLFIEKGYHATTIKEIAAAAGISEPVIYKHFVSKKELFFEVFYKVASKSFENLELYQELEPKELVEKFLQQHLKNLDDNFNVFKFIIVQIMQDEEIREDFLKNFIPKISARIYPYLKKIKNNYSPLFNCMLLGGIIIPFVMGKGLFGIEPEGLSREELTNRLSEIYIRALSENQEV